MEASNIYLPDEYLEIIKELNNNNNNENNNKDFSLCLDSEFSLDLDLEISNNENIEKTVKKRLVSRPCQGIHLFLTMWTFKIVADTRKISTRIKVIWGLQKSPLSRSTSSRFGSSTPPT